MVFYDKNLCHTFQQFFFSLDFSDIPAKTILLFEKSILFLYLKKYR